MGGTDAVLAARLAAGDDHALAEVFDALAYSVYGSALRVLGDNSAAQDVVQDVFVELWTRPDRYDPAAGTLRTYLTVLGKHRAVDLIRSELRRVARQERSYGLTPAPLAAGAGDEVMAAETASVVRAAVQLLPASQRQVVELAYFEGLRERVLAASLRARAVGRPVPDAPEISATEAYSRAASAFYAALCFLSDDDWRTPVLRDLDIQGLVGHLIGVEDDMHRAMEGDPEVADASHVESTQAAAIHQTGRPPADTRADWRRTADRTLDLVRFADFRTEIAMHGMRLSLCALLVVRAFELWTHENDIRQAAGWVASVPDPSTLRLMTELAARLLPRAVDRAGLAEPVDLRLVLTGPGGGTWDMTLGADALAPAAVSIVIDAVGFCRLVANRVTPSDLDVHVTGDPARATEVLAAATTLALD